MAKQDLTNRIRNLIKENLHGVISGEPEVKVQLASEMLTDEELLINEIMEEDLDSTIHVETTLRFFEPVEYINVSFKLNE